MLRFHEHNHLKHCWKIGTESVQLTRLEALPPRKVESCTSSGPLQGESCEAGQKRLFAKGLETLETSKIRLSICSVKLKNPAHRMSSKKQIRLLLEIKKFHLSHVEDIGQKFARPGL